MHDFRCSKCNKLLAKYRGCEMLEIKCPRCGLTNKLNNNTSFSPELNKPNAMKVLKKSLV